MIAQASEVLPEPDSPTRPSTSPRRDRERHVVQHAQRARGASRSRACSPATARIGGHRSSRGLSASRRPSPSRLKPIAVSAMATAGATIIQGAWCMKRRASATISPHSEAGGWAPRPRKAERREQHHGEGDADRRLDHDRRDDVGQHLAQHDPGRRSRRARWRR